MDLRNCSQYSTFIIIGNVHYLLNMINSEFIRGIDKKKSADQLLWGSAESIVASNYRRSRQIIRAHGHSLFIP